MKKKVAVLMSLLLSASTVGMAACGASEGGIKESEYYTITVACQTEKGEKEVMDVLAKQYEAKYPDRKVEVKTMANGYDQYMLTIASDRSMSPNVIWTSDTSHSSWDEYHVDLRPYFEQSAETNYSLYYETMLDTAGTHGQFKPTKSYKGEFRKDDLDTTDGRSDYSLYYAPRDYNKPALLCNTYIFNKLDTEYEELYKSLNSVTEMPTDYQSTTARLNSIVEGVEWDDMTDLYAFAKTIAGRIAYLVNNHPNNKTAREWDKYRALNLFLDWEPTYTTVMHDMGIDLFNDNGELQLEQHKDKFAEIYSALSPQETAEDKELAEYVHSIKGDQEFSQGTLFMRVCSRPLVLGYGNSFRGSYGSTSLQAIRLPMEYIAAGCSGYAISRVWDGADKGIKVNGVFKSYTELSWDFIKFIITQEGQEAAGATGLNIPVLKSLYDAESNGGVEPAWRKVENLGDMDNDAWVAGKELKQDLFNIYQAKKRPELREIIKFFFIDLQKYSDDEGYLDDIIENYAKAYKNKGPANCLLAK